MRKHVRIVEVKVINNVGVAQRVDEEQFVVGGPVSPRNDDGLRRRAFANGHCEFRLHTLPAVAILEFRLIQYLQEHQVRIPRRVVLRQRPPVIRELFHKLIVGNQFFLEVRVWVHVNNHGQALIQNHFHCGIEIAEVVFGNLVRLLAAKHRLRVHA